LEGEDIEQSSGEMSREDAKVCLQANCELENALLQLLRHCEEPLRRSNPGCFRGGILDCFRLPKGFGGQVAAARNEETQT